MMKVLTITKALEEFIQEVEAVSPFMRDYSTTGFYMAKFDVIGYQVCPLQTPSSELTILGSERDVQVPCLDRIRVLVSYLALCNPGRKQIISPK